MNKEGVLKHPLIVKMACSINMHPEDVFHCIQAAMGCTEDQLIQKLQEDIKDD